MRRSDHRPAVRGLLPLLAFVLALVAGPAWAQAFSTRFSTTANGDVVLVGNMILHCSGNATACTNARNTTTPGGTINNGYTMVYVDIDSDASTFSSSSAQLVLPAGSNILFAGLYWAGQSANASRNQIRLMVPGSTTYQTLASTQLYTNGSAYQGFRDVTSIVQAAGAGTYTAANVYANSGNGGAWGGWQLVVAYSNTSEPTRNMNVFDGFLYANGSGTGYNDIDISGFVTPLTGTVNSRLGIVIYDGDRGANDTTAAGDPSLAFGTTTGTLNPVFNTPNPQRDVYNSTVSDLGSYVTTRNPAYQNTLGVDIDRLVPNTPLPNGATSARLRVRGTSGDVNYQGVVTLVTEVFVPNLVTSLVKSSGDVNGNTLVPGEQLLYTITSTNTGNDGAASNVLTDPIPANTTYVPGSLVINSGANAGAKTDAAGDDQAEFLTGPNRVVFRLGTGANAGSGGLILPTQSFSVSFRVTVNAGTPNATVISNQAQLNYNGQTLGTPVVAQSDGDAGTPGQQPTTNTINTTTGITVSKDNAQVNYTPGVQSTYTIVIGNTGPATAHGAVVRDTPPAGMTFGSLTCTGATGGAVCPSGAGFNVTALGDGTGIPLPALPPGGTITLQVTATVN